jgi:hypothetical protein
MAESIPHYGSDRCLAPAPSERDQQHRRRLEHEVGAYVLDKNYFPTAESVKAASNVVLLSSKPAAMRDGDKLIELRTTFLLIRR